MSKMSFFQGKNGQQFSIFSPPGGHFPKKKFPPGHDFPIFFPVFFPVIFSPENPVVFFLALTSKNDLGAEGAEDKNDDLFDSAFFFRAPKAPLQRL